VSVIKRILMMMMMNPTPCAGVGSRVPHEGNAVCRVLSAHRESGQGENAVSVRPDLKSSFAQESSPEDSSPCSLNQVHGE